MSTDVVVLGIACKSVGGDSGAGNGNMNILISFLAIDLSSLSSTSITILHWFVKVLSSCS